MILALSIAGFGALGCLARYYLSWWVHASLGKTSFPFATLAVNVIGAFAIGLVMEMGLRSEAIPPNLRAALTVGFLGGLTTFSTFSYETYRLLEDGKVLVAAANVLASALVCLLFTWLGVVTAKQF